MTSIIDQQIITIHILANISICKISQAIKLGQLWDITWEIFSFKNHGENKAESLVPELFLFFKKALYKVKASGHHFSFNIFWYTSTWTYNKSKLITFHWAITVGNMYIEFICWPVCFSTKPTSQDKSLINKKSFELETKRIFHHF